MCSTGKLTESRDEAVVVRLRVQGLGLRQIARSDRNVRRKRHFDETHLAFLERHLPARLILVRDHLDTHARALREIGQHVAGRKRRDQEVLGVVLARIAPERRARGATGNYLVLRIGRLRLSREAAGVERGEPMNAGGVRGALERILASPDFHASARNRRFLEYLVEETLAGRADQLKGLTLAIDVFGRDAAAFDPERDPVVRIEAAKLRRSLDERRGRHNWRAFQRYVYSDLSAILLKLDPAHVFGGPK